ncbi:hypothetical protein GCM10022261_05930 [Brevibacterium daeguense]|uniref:DUF2306 domain-containing protein n=1 Tax=Brevibacterium daeguense TaxID=909936 RepID=A0ABP8EGI6_9MICO|nr:DUF2306 domain-containing protein [Brevibacterium daeguense]
MIAAHIVIAVHALAGSLVILLAPVNLLRRPKDSAHRMIGRSWVLMMYLVCVSGMFIYSLSGGFTIFHALAIFTFGTTTLGVLAIRRRDVRSHIGNMVGSWLGAIGAGAFAFAAPGRTIPTLAIEDPALLWGLVSAVVLVATGWVSWVLLRVPDTRRPTRPSRPVAPPVGAPAANTPVAEAPARTGAEAPARTGAEAPAGSLGDRGLPPRPRIG